MRNYGVNCFFLAGFLLGCAESGDPLLDDGGPVLEDVATAKETDSGAPDAGEEPFTPDTDTEIDTELPVDELPDTDPETDPEEDTEIDTELPEDSGTDTSPPLPAGCLEGSITLENVLDAEVLAPYQCVTGDLLIYANGTEGFNLPLLTSIGGTLGISGSIETFDGLSTLREVAKVQIYTVKNITSCEICGLLNQLNTAPDLGLISPGTLDECWADGGLSC